MKKIKKEYFDQIVKDYLQQYNVKCEFHNEAEQELRVTVTPVIERKALMQLIGECDRQRLGCYVSGADDRTAVFVAFTEN
jgi:hypothetical protein